MPLSSPIYRLKQNAKRRARAEGLPLHKALDQIAINEGFRSWSHLSSSEGSPTPERQMRESLTAGDLALIGARPGQGKTLLALRVLLEAAKAGQKESFSHWNTARKTLPSGSKNCAAHTSSKRGRSHLISLTEFARDTSSKR
ncbi:DnaB helicase-like protein [Roseibium hamelinense]|uniref:DnaB helicase-like protein n=1 Tax=Roseibium hamelinense TaxID=150831 RepID=A0A562TH25_9HYPH|nr:hypothetical protein [Roseibium hamelinense]TWI92643.1 DnaB helicase-like protein [Roseibium hamelinense]